ncbi:MAG: nitrophenyl compound nitroreductase subunit ArsF family protein [Bacteroidales bacterium]|nr:nitrophenyl compound nitroreductase subunit ArsF family protein [Bacteroidales bacterium]
MRMTIITLFFMSMIAMQFPCNAQDNPAQTNNEEVKSSDLGVYYFHFERRCNTCISVENNSKKALEELYPEPVKSGEYFFKSVNLDEAAGKEIGEKMGIGMQTLIVVHGDKKVDITGEGFMYVDNYERLKAEVKKAVEKALKE